MRAPHCKSASSKATTRCTLLTCWMSRSPTRSDVVPCTATSTSAMAATRSGIMGRFRFDIVDPICARHTVPEILICGDCHCASPPQGPKWYSDIERKYADPTTCVGYAVSRMSELLEKFLTAPSADDQLKAIVEMTKEKVLVRIAKTREFWPGVLTLATRVDSSKEDEQVAAIIALARIASSVRQRRQDVNALLAESIKKPPVAIDTLSVPEDRAYVIAACRTGPHDWAGPFYARMVVVEEHADQIRNEAARGLIENTVHFRSAIELAFRELRLLRFETEHPSNSLAKRLRRVLSALRGACAELTPIPGEGVGRSLADSLDMLFRPVGPPKAASRKGILIEAADLVHELVRSRFSQATIAETYEVLTVIRRWYDASEWEALVPDVESLKHVSRDLAEALSLLARASVTDDQLASVLPVVTGSAATASNMRQTLAFQTTGLTDEVRAWLSGLPPKKRSSKAEESQQRRADVYIAELLLRVWQQQAVGESHANAIPNDVIETIKALARSRSLTVADDADKVVEFSPLEHEIVGGFVAGLRYVRVIEPSVRSVFADGRVRTVRKSLAEPVIRRNDSRGAI